MKAGSKSIKVSLLRQAGSVCGICRAHGDTRLPTKCVVFGELMVGAG